MVGKKKGYRVRGAHRGLGTVYFYYCCLRVQLRYTTYNRTAHALHLLFLEAYIFGTYGYGPPWHI